MTPVARRRGRVPIWFLLPGLAVYALIVLYPSFSGAVYAFTDWDGGPSFAFTGLDNLGQMMASPSARSALFNTLVLAFTNVIVQTALGLLLALALNTAIRGRNILRTLYFAPMLLPPVIIAVLWQFMYLPGGPLDTLFSVFGLGQFSPNWLGSSSVALWSVIATVVWQYTGITMVIYLAALQGIPEELHEAAALDGAGKVRIFWHITRPLLGHATTIAVALTLIGSFKLFDQVFVMTGGGPGYSTEVLSLLMYKEAFVLGHYGYGTAIALVLTIVVAFVAFVQISASQRAEVVQ